MLNLVSVIIPTYCGTETLRRAINSILAQTYDNIEIIIVDDNNPNSNERKLTEIIIESFDLPNIRYIKHSKNSNGAVARNTGIDIAKGKYICFLDDDDFYLPNRIEDSVKILETNIKYDAVFCDVAIFNNKEIINIIKTSEKKLKQKNLILDEMLIGTGSNIFMRRSVAIELGGFDQTFVRHQDLEFLIRFFENYKAIGINKILIVKGINSTNNIPKYNEFLMVKEKYFEKFKVQIDRLNENEKKQFFLYHYGILFRSAIETMDIKNIKYIVEKINIYGRLNIKQIILILLIKTKLYKSPLYYVIKNKLLKYIRFKRKQLKSTSEFKFNLHIEELLN